MKTRILPFFWLLAGILCAQRPLALPEALDLALRNSAQLKKAQLDRQALEARIQEGRSAMLPQISAGAGLEYAPLLPTQFLPADLFGGSDGTYVAATNGQPWQLNAGLRAEQTLLHPAGKRMAPAADLSRALHDLLTVRAEEELLFNTATVFYQTLQTQQLMGAVQANLDKLQALQGMVELQLANQYATPTDVKRIRVARTNLETQRLTLANGIAALRQTLQFLCGIPLDERVELLPENTPAAADSARWQTLAPAPEAGTEYQLLQRRLELNRVEQHALRGENLPSLSAYAAAGLLAQNTDANFFSGGQRWYGLASLGFKLKVPVFDGFRTRRKTAWLAIEGQKIAEDSRQLREAKILEFYQARDQFGGALQMLRTQDENVALAREIADKITLQYQEGMAPLTDLLQAQTALAEAQANHAQQVFIYKLAVLKLLKAAGKLSLLRS